jgi:hypothetical protein
MKSRRAQVARVFPTAIIPFLLLVLVGCGNPNAESGEELELTQDAGTSGFAGTVTTIEPDEPADPQGGEEPESTDDTGDAGWVGGGRVIDLSGELIRIESIGLGMEWTGFEVVQLWREDSADAEEREDAPDAEEREDAPDAEEREDAPDLSTFYHFTLTEGTLRDSETGAAEALGGAFTLRCADVSGPDCERPAEYGAGLLRLQDYRLESGEEIYAGPWLRPVPFEGASFPGPQLYVPRPAILADPGFVMSEGEISRFTLVLSQEVIEADEDSQTIRFEALLGEGTAQAGGGGGDSRFVLPMEMTVEGARVAFEQTFEFSPDACELVPEYNFILQPELPSLEEMGLYAPDWATVRWDPSGVLSVYTEGDLEVRDADFEIPGLTGLSFLARGSITVEGEVRALSEPGVEADLAMLSLIAGETITLDGALPASERIVIKGGEIVIREGSQIAATDTLEISETGGPRGLFSRPDTGADGGNVTLTTGQNDTDLFVSSGLENARPTTNYSVSNYSASNYYQELSRVRPDDELVWDLGSTQNNVGNGLLVALSPEFTDQVASVQGYVSGDDPPPSGDGEILTLSMISSVTSDDELVWDLGSTQYNLANGLLVALSPEFTDQVPWVRGYLSGDDPRPRGCVDGPCRPGPIEREYRFECGLPTLVSESEPEEIGSFSFVASRASDAGAGNR